MPPRKGDNKDPAGLTPAGPSKPGGKTTAPKKTRPRKPTAKAKYTQFVERGKNLLRRRRAFGADSKPEKIDVGLALLAVADNIKALQRVARFKADMYQAKHNPAVATCEEYESSDSEVESEAFPGEDDNGLELEAKLACQPEPSPARSHISNDDFSDVEDGDVAA